MPMQMGLVLWDRANPDCGTGNADMEACKIAGRRPAMKRTRCRSQLLFRSQPPVQIPMYPSTPVPMSLTIE